jgi:hypothetical protein
LYPLVEEHVIDRRRRVRKWRLRGRRGQVSAVATILGLLLVVTFIANYLTTTLPGQMSVNDLNHDVQVQDQVGRLQALLQAAADSGDVGAQFSQPITLGGVGEPPFAGPDSGWISPGNLSGGFGANFTVSIHPKVVGTGPAQDGAPGTGACTGAGTTRCASGTWFTLAVTPTNVNDLLVLVITTYELSVAALTTADIVDTALSTWTLDPAGGNEVVHGTSCGGGFCQFVFWAIDTGIGADVVTVGVVGLTAHDGSAVLVAMDDVNAVNPISATGAFARGDSTTASAVVSAPQFGSVLGLVSSVTASGVFPTITANSAGTPCTATCTAIASQHGEAFGVTYAESEPVSSAGVYTASATLSATEDWGEMALAINPEYTTPPSIPISTGAPPPGASLVVHLANTYLPSAEVAFDQGGVVFAQPGSAPILLDPPDFTYNQSGVSLTIPFFQGTVPVESGVGTTDILVKLVSTSTYVFPNTGLVLVTNSHVTFNLITPYWAAWMTYFASNGNFAGYVACTLGGAACPAAVTATYVPSGPLATITFSLPATSLTLTVATFSVSVT